MSKLLARLFGGIFADAEYNKQLYKNGYANKNIVQYTAIGWRPDPINQEDGFTEKCGTTPSGNREYSKVITKGK